MKNILIPIDFSENSWNATIYALKFFEKSSCTFYLLHVNTYNYVSTNESPYIYPKDFIDETVTKPAKEKLKIILKLISEQFPGNERHHFFTLSDNDFFIESVRRHVLEKKIDMIVMGTKGASGLKRIIIGSNAADVIRRVQCNTLIVPENAQFTNLDEVAFPTDYYLAYSANLLKPLHDILQQHNSNLQVLHIIEKPGDFSMSQQENKELLTDYFDKSKTSFFDLNNKRVGDALDSFVQIRDIKLIAMVAKNLNYFQRILFHSEAENMAYHTHIPFLVMHDSMSL